jgi:hypothetical protein
MVLPVLLTHPITSATRLHSWDAQQGGEGWLLYSFYNIIMGGIALTSVASSYASKAAFCEFQGAQRRLVSLAAKAEGLLETAMPSSIARDLISGRRPEELTNAFESASVAFIALAGIDELTARLSPSELLQVSHTAGRN